MTHCYHEIAKVDRTNLSVNMQSPYRYYKIIKNKILVAGLAVAVLAIASSYAVAAGGIDACSDDDTTLCGLETTRDHNDPDFTAANIKNGTNILGVTGSYTGPSAAPACTDDATIECTLEATRANDDSDFSASNIKSGVNILGVTGSYTGGSSFCSAPALCPNVGDVCDDSDAGTTNDPIFAGCMNYSGIYAPLFVSNNNQSTSSQWKTSNGTDDIATDYIYDGKLNSAQVPNSTTFPAFKLCKDLTDGGYSDWYLPSHGEGFMLWENRALINANAEGNFTTSDYWSSSETSTRAWYHIFTFATSHNTEKTYSKDVRCVRRD